MRLPSPTDHLSVITDSTLFKTIPRKHAEAIALMAEVRDIARGELVCDFLDIPTHLHGVLDGLLRAELTTAHGAIHMPVAHPEFCGWPGLVYPYRSYMKVEAATDGRLVSVPIAGLRALMAENADLRADVVHQVAALGGQLIDDLIAILQEREPLFIFPSN